MVHTGSHRIISASRGRRIGFTLVEMLIVLGIALLLMAIILPAVNVAYNRGVRTRMAADLQAIVIALEAYRQDHGDIPRVNGANTGAAILCQALIAPGPASIDGKDGFGFRNRKASADGTPQGRAFGPYLDPDKFKIEDPAKTSTPRILDLNGMPILYFPGFKSADITAANGYIATTGKPMFNASDNAMSQFDNGQGGTGLAKFKLLMGCNPDGSAGPNPSYVGPYLLWSAGPDEKFSLPKNAPPSPGNKCDDVANFDRDQY